MSYIVVLGGGYVGQLVQLALPSVRVLDWRKQRPVHHLDTRMGPQYLWEPIPGVESVNFPVITMVDYNPPTPDSILAYKRKIGKESDGGDWGLQFQYQTTGWHSQLPVPRIEYNRHVQEVDLYPHRLILSDEVRIEYDILINTIPLDFFLKLCTIPPLVHHPWKQDPIYMSVAPAKAPIDGMILNYLSDPTNRVYRETVTAEHRFSESLSAPGKGDPPATRILPGKIHPHPESEEVLRSLRIFDVYSFGRFGTWRPDELAHQTFQEILKWKESLT